MWMQTENSAEIISTIITNYDMQKINQWRIVWVIYQAKIQKKKPAH